MKKNKLATQKTLKAELIGLSGILSATIFSGIGLVMTNFVSAEANETAVKTATVHVEATCSLTKTVNTAHTVTLLGGHVSEDFGTSTFNASCNDPSGYAIYAIGFSDDTMGGTDMIAASPLDSSSNIKTGTDGTDSYWAVKLTAGGSGAAIENSFNNYHVIPNSYVKVAEKSSATTSSEVAFTSTYKISLAGTQPAGLYNGKVKYTLVNPSTACPDGYEMKDGVCILTLSEISTMQEMTSGVCANTPTPLASAGENTPQYQLIDTRDGKLYWVAKLADGNCWMTQNLDFVLDPSKPLTPEDSDVTSNWTPSIATQTTQYKELDGTTHTTGADNALWNTTDTTFGYNYAPHSYRPASDATAGMSGQFGEFTITTTYFSPVFIQNGTTMKDWKTMADCTGAGNSEELCAHWNVGTFYSWYAATAGTGNNSVTSRGANVLNSICPKGWRLPKSGSSDDDFQALVNNGMTKTNITDAPFYFLRSGYYIGDYGAVYGTGSFGDYWSSTSGGSSNAYYLFFDSGGVHPSYSDPRYVGLSVRCVAR